jgi:ABC-2 type transport system permease protein
VAFIGIIALVPAARELRNRLIPGPGRYYFFITAAIVLFACFAAPEALCPDRRSRFLGIYLASPLSRTTYLVAKVLAVLAALLLVTLGPPLLLLIGLALQNYGPRGVPAFLGTLTQIIVAGVALSAMFGALSLAVPSLTDRRGFASAGSLLLILGTSAVANVVTFGLRASNTFLLLALNRLPFELALRIFTLRGLPTRTSDTLSTVWVIGASLAVTVVAAAVTWWRVARTPVTR